MVRSVVWTTHAYEKFNELSSYLEHEWGNGVAQTFVGKTYRIVETLAKYPKLGTKEDKERGIRGFPITK